MSNLNIDIRSFLIEKLKQHYCLWSYEKDSVQDIPDMLVGLVIKLLPYKTVKRAWIENIVAQGERYYDLNYFLAWYYFHAKHPRCYVKAMATR